MKHLMKVTFACILTMAAMSAHTQAADRPAKTSAVTAIDILLEPDATMLQHSADNNTRLLKVFPKGFSLDATHTPHITLLQCFARTADLDKVYAAASQVLARANVKAMMESEHTGPDLSQGGCGPPLERGIHPAATDE